MKQRSFHTLSSAVRSPFQSPASASSTLILCSNTCHCAPSYPSPYASIFLNPASAHYTRTRLRTCLLRTSTPPWCMAINCRVKHRSLNARQVVVTAKTRGRETGCCEVGSHSWCGWMCGVEAGDERADEVWCNELAAFLAKELVSNPACRTADRAG